MLPLTVNRLGGISYNSVCGLYDSDYAGACVQESKTKDHFVAVSIKTINNGCSNDRG